MARIVGLRKKLVVKAVAASARGRDYSWMQRISAAADDVGYLVTLGKAIRAFRKKRGFSQEKLAYDAHVDRSHMGKIERGERNVTILNIVRICDVLECSPSELLQVAEELHRSK